MSVGLSREVLYLALFGSASRGIFPISGDMLIGMFKPILDGCTMVVGFN